MGHEIFIGNIKESYFSDCGVLAAAGCSQDQPEKALVKVFKKDQAAINYERYTVLKKRFAEAVPKDYADLGNENWGAVPESLKPVDHKIVPVQYLQQIAALEAETRPIITRYVARPANEEKIGFCERLINWVATNPLPSASVMEKLVYPPAYNQMTTIHGRIDGALTRLEDMVDNPYIPPVSTASLLDDIESNIETFRLKLPSWRAEIATTKAPLQEYAAKLVQKREMLKADSYYCAAALNAPN